MDKYLLCVFPMGPNPSTFPPGRAVKAKINIFLCSLAAGMDNIGKLSISDFWEVLEGPGTDSWPLEKRGAKNMDQEWVWSYRSGFKSLNPTKSFLDSKFEFPSLHWSPQSPKISLEIPSQTSRWVFFFPHVFPSVMSLGVGWWCDLLHLLGTRALQAQI